MGTEMDELKPTLEFRIQALDILTNNQGSLISRLRGKVLSMGIHLTSLDSNVKSLGGLGDLGEVVEDHIDRLSTLSGRMHDHPIPDPELLSERLKNYDERVTRLGAQIGALNNDYDQKLAGFRHDIAGRVQLCIDGINELRKQAEGSEVLRVDAADFMTELAGEVGRLKDMLTADSDDGVLDLVDLEDKYESLFEEVRSVADRLNAYILEVRERLNGLESKKSKKRRKSAGFFTITNNGKRPIRVQVTGEVIE